MTVRVRGLAIAGALGVLAIGAIVAPAAMAAPEEAQATSDASAWAPVDSAAIRPGVVIETEGGGACTSNFIFTSGDRVFIGQAAHCAGTGEATETNGCDSGSRGIGTPVTILATDGTKRSGKIAYSSWVTMQKKGEADPDTCAYNDLALVRVNPSDVANVNPSVPGFGGPTGVGSWGGTGSTVYTYGNSSLRGGVTALSPKQGVVVQNGPSGWTHDVYTVTPGIPGDSGSGFLNASGAAIGVLSTVQLAPLAGSNGVGDLGKELAYARSHGFGGLQLVPGTEAFNGDTVGAVLRGLGL
jgi:hypothetical protein